jgi:hypothetical protein
MADNIPGTNIPKSAVANNIKGDWQYWAARLRGAENPNDVLFSMAYTTPFTGMTLLPGQDVWQGQGQGNPNVGALQSNIWSLTGDQPSWAEQAVQNPGGQSDIYQDRSDPNNITAVVGADYGQPASADDIARAGTNLAGQSHFFYGTNMPTTGFTVTQINDFNNRLRTEIDSQNWRGANDVMFDIAWGMGKNFYGSPTDDQGGYGQGNKFVGMLQSDMFSLTDPSASMWGEDYINSENDVYTLRDISGNPRGETIRYDDDTGSYIDTGGTTLAEGGLGSLYRPWTTSYWDKYLGPDVKKSLFSMKAPPVEQSLAYLPGEFRDPAGWRAVLDASGDYMENIPAGAWRHGTMGPTGLNAPGWPALGQGNPWQFTSPASATNIAYTPGFTGADISPAAAADWHGLLSNLGDTPRIDASPTSLLGGSDTAGVPYTTRTIIN